MTNSHVPAYAKMAAISRPKPVDVPNFGRGKGVGSALSQLQLLYDPHDQNKTIDSALSKVAADELTKTIKTKLADDGHTGYLLLVRRFKHRDSGAARGGFEGPIPVGSGYSPADAVARNVLLSNKTQLGELPNGHEYDPQRSFTIWVTDDDGDDLNAVSIPFPHALYRDAQNLIVTGAVDNLTVAEELSTRSLKYSRRAELALDTAKGKESAAVIASLLRTRQSLANSVQRSQDLLKLAKSEEKNASNWATIQKFFSTAGYAVGKLQESDKKSSVPSPEAAKTVVNNDIRNYNKVEQRLDLTVNVIIGKDAQPYEPLPYLP